LNKNIQKILSFFKSHKVFSVFSFSIVAFHLIAQKSIQIINAITFESEDLFSVNIQWLKVLLEPIVGLPLFYLRSSQPIQEYILLWVWIFMVLGIVFIIKQRRFLGSLALCHLST
jgi:ABC-type tungstate transport system substrate-binding protein